MVGTLASSGGTGIFKSLFILMFFMALAITGFYLVSVSTVPNAHALARHGEEATMAHSCINDGGTIQATVTRKIDGHKAIVCQIMGTFYVYVEDKCGNEVTSMCKNKMSRLDQVIQYLKNRGYE